MKKFLETLKTKAQNVKEEITETVHTVENKLAVKAMNVKAELAGEAGANTHTDVSIWIVIGVTLGAIALAILIILFRDTVMKTVTQMIKDMFAKKTQTT